MKYGLGRHVSTLSPKDLTQYFKVPQIPHPTSAHTKHAQFTYSSQVVGIFAMAFSKASIALLIRRLSVYHSSFFRASLPIVTVGIWAIFSLFASIFQCNLPNPWTGSPKDCPAREVLWSAILVLNIVSDALLAVYIIPGVSRLNMPKPVRLTIVGLFACRLSVCVASGIQMARLIQDTGTSDPTCTLSFCVEGEDKRTNFDRRGYARVCSGDGCYSPPLFDHGNNPSDPQLSDRSSNGSHSCSGGGSQWRSPTIRYQSIYQR